MLKIESDAACDDPTALQISGDRGEMARPLRRRVRGLAGKALPGFLIGPVEASAIIAVAALWFDVPLRGSLSALYAGLVLFLLSAAGWLFRRRTV